ncbi:MAG: ATP synthase F1 subunit delta [Acidobacteriota bacterium]
MSITTIANRYGRALAEVVLEKGEHAEVQEELRAFVQMYQESAELREVFANPTISQQQQRAVLDALVARAKPRPTTVNFLLVLLKNYRMRYLPNIYQAFTELLDERLNVVTAEVTTAVPVNNEQQNLLSEQLRKITGKKVRLKFQVDPAIIGGVVTRIGSQIYDGSIRNQLELLRTQLSRA